MKRVLLALVLLAGLAGGAALAGLSWFRGALEPASASEETVDFEVARGATLKNVAATLAARGVIRDARAFEWLARWREEAGKLQVGEYALAPSQGAEEILAVLVEGRVKTYEVAIPEGLTAREIAARMEAAGVAQAAAFLAVVEAPESAERFGVEGPGLEGYLYPETYRFPRGMPTDAVVGVLIEHFLDTWREVADAAKARDLSMREVVTLASIVEKETGAAVERPLIASVFHNRLERGMRLESDPTTIYGIPNFDGNLRRRDLENGENPYNTYKIAGLPPGPIANPGAEALRAVVAPAKSSYLFFVSRNDGTHVFSKSYAEHDRNVDRFQRRGRRKKSPSK